MKIEDFGASWRDGRTFVCLVNCFLHSPNFEYDPRDSNPVADVDGEDFTNLYRLERAFSAAEIHLEIPRLLDPRG